ncbi:hypothetical protein J3R30DRAFT_944973 [Lentinula aciculospora]|uniref:Uncharacterized protein n=1 Tax=Lentinula aciculospora TaxID=153920 RepID=A0A9W9AQU5_9AGAR|nr:hypothetical protein J3R30DRAFT_944973 [Lentinula aciculospora]
MSVHSSVDDNSSKSSSSASSSYSSISASSYTTSVSSLPSNATDTTLTTESSMMLQWREEAEIHAITHPELPSDHSVRHQRRSSRDIGQNERERHGMHHRTRTHSCKRARSHEIYREREFNIHLARDFFLIITFCFVLACCLICIGRPFALVPVLDRFLG